LAALAILLLVIGPLVVLALKRRRRVRRRRTRDPNGRVVGAWQEAVERVRSARVEVAASLTNTEVVHAAGASLGPDVAHSLSDLRHLTNAAMFAGAPATDAQAEQAWAEADAVAAQVRQGQSPLRRLVAAVDPRTLRRPRTG